MPETSSSQEAVPIGPDDEALTVARRVTEAAVAVLARSWPKLKAGTASRPLLWSSLAKGSYFGGRKPEASHRLAPPGAQEVHDLVRAVTRPWPGAFTDVLGPRVTIWKTRLSGYGGHDTFPERSSSAGEVRHHLCRRRPARGDPPWRARGAAGHERGCLWGH